MLTSYVIQITDPKTNKTGKEYVAIYDDKRFDKDNILSEFINNMNSDLNLACYYINPSKGLLILPMGTWEKLCKETKEQKNNNNK